VSAQTKLELLGLIDAATAAGWPHGRACAALGLADVRAHRWRARLRETGSLEDRRPVGTAVHRILAWEEEAILRLIDEWAPVDRSHRKLAHRGSYTGAVFVSPSTLLRVALRHRITLPGEPLPDELRDEIRLECSPAGLDHDRRAPALESAADRRRWTTMKVAQLRHDTASKQWSLYCRDSHERW
jgi:hypothetical protein